MLRWLLKITLKKDANAQVVLNQLYKHTQMQDTFGVIMLALVNGEPKILTLKECLDEYVKHRREVILRRTKFDLEKAEARAHILEGLLKAIDNIDEVIQIIRSSYDDAKERLMERFDLSDIQAQAILDMQLKRLSGLQREKLEDEYAELMKLIAYYKEILASETLVFDIIKTELLEIRDTLQIPIIMTEDKVKNVTRFHVATEQRLLYIYEIKLDDFRSPKDNLETKKDAKFN